MDVTFTCRLSVGQRPLMPLRARSDERSSLRVTIRRRCDSGEPLRVHTSGMGRRWLLCGAILAVVLVLVGVLTWRVWPRDPGPVAPQVSARELRQAERFQHGNLTLVGGGSKTEAHRLWDYYRGRPPLEGSKPRLLGISRVRLSNSPTLSDGFYWLVFSDHVYQYALGGCCGGVGRQVAIIPDGSKSIYGSEIDF